MNQKRSIFPYLLLGVAILLIGFGLYNLNKMPDNKYPEIKNDFSLHSADAQVSSKDMLGKVGIIYFGYTHCPDVCPASLVNIAGALKLLTPDELKKVMPVFITTDPDRDTPELMAKYAHHFHPQIIGLSGSAQEIKEAAQSFKTGYQKEKPNEKGGYAVSHASYIIIVRPDGNIGDMISHSSKPEDIATTIRFWLKWT